MKMKTSNVLQFFILLKVAIIASALTTQYEWRYMDYLWESPTQRAWYNESGLYNLTAVFPMDVERSKDGRTFITTIRMTGVPVSLSTVSSTFDGESGYLLKPYPNWSWYDPRNTCKGIVGAYNIFIDECNRLWVLDTGVINTNHLCPPKLLAFDLSTDKLIFMKQIDDNVARDQNGVGMLVMPVVEIDGPRCSDFTVYMADIQGFGLLIMKNNNVIRINGNAFRAEVRNSDFNIVGGTFHLEEGLLAMALLPRMGQRTNNFLFFRPLASRSLYYTNTNVLRSGFANSTVNFHGSIDVFSSQVPAMAFSSEGTLFYVPVTQLAIGCWNVNNPMQPQYFNTVLRDVERLQFVSGLRMKRAPNAPRQEYLLMLSNKYQRVDARNMNYGEINFRIMVQSVEGIVCNRR